jgi:hypothetical protein
MIKILLNNLRCTIGLKLNLCTKKSQKVASFKIVTDDSKQHSLELLCAAVTITAVTPLVCTVLRNITTRSTQTSFLCTVLTVITTRRSHTSRLCTVLSAIMTRSPITSLLCTVLSANMTRSTITYFLCTVLSAYEP